MIYFKKLKDPDNPTYDRVDVLMRCDAVDLDTICDAFADFLRAIGYAYIEDIEVTKKLN